MSERFDERVPFSVWLCGGSGKLTPEAKAELESFGAHLREHPRDVRVAGCRFCANRRPIVVPSSEARRGE